MFKCMIPNVRRNPTINVIYSTKPLNTETNSDFFEEFDSITVLSSPNCIINNDNDKNTKTDKNFDNNTENIAVVENSAGNMDNNLNTKPKANEENLSRLDKNIDNNNRTIFYTDSMLGYGESKSNYQTYTDTPMAGLEQSKRDILASLNDERSTILNTGERYVNQLSLCDSRLKTVQKLVEQQDKIMKDQQRMLKLLQHPLFRKIMVRKLNREDFENLKRFISNIDTELYSQLKQELLQDLEIYRENLVQ